MKAAYSDEMVMAYADGELTGPDREAFEAALAGDPELQARVEAQRALGFMIGGAHAGVLDEAVPERLLAAAATATAPTEAEVVSLQARRAARPPLRADWRAIAAMAACLAVGVVAGAVWKGTGDVSLLRAADGGLTATGALDRALDAQLAADPGEVVKVGLSFRSAEGGYCRTFRVARGEGLAGLACREDGDWRVRMAVEAESPAAAGGYRTAGTDTPAEVLAAVEAIIDGTPLDAQAEAAARARGWR